MEDNVKGNPSPSEQAIQKFVSDNLNKADLGSPLIIRTGVAPKQLDALKPNKVHLAGTIKAPAEFYGKRKLLHNPEKCHVLYNILKGEIILVVDENFENDNYEITGTLEPNSELKKFLINTGTCFEPKDLLKVLKFSRVYFEDKAEHNKICLSLMNFKAKVATALEGSNDLRGEKINNLHSKITHDLQESFLLNIAIFKGQEKTQIKVDVCLELRAGEVYVFLESVMLKDMEMSVSEGIIKSELDKFTDIVCIER